MQRVSPPPDAPSRADWRIVRVWDGAAWRPMLLEAWIRLSDGWACRLRWYGYRATGGPVTHTATVRYDPVVVQPLVSADISPVGPPLWSPDRP